MFRYVRTWAWGVLPASAVVAASVYFINVAALPDPATADRDGLARWLVLTEIRDRDRQLQLTLLDRIQQEFAEPGAALDAEQAGLSEAYQQRLERNLAHLQELWFHSRCEEVVKLEGDQRANYLDRQIEFAQRWGDLSSSAGSHDVFDQIDDWIAAAEGARKATAQDGVRWALHRFLQTHDLNDFPEEMRLELANRIVEDLEDGARLEGFEESSTADAVAAAVTSPDLLEANGMLLIRTWLTQQARQYSQLSPDEQNKYLARRLQQIKDWNIVALFAGSEESNRLDALIQFAATTQKWIRESSDEDRPAMQKLFRDISQRLMFGPS